ATKQLSQVFKEKVPPADGGDESDEFDLFDIKSQCLSTLRSLMEFHGVYLGIRTIRRRIRKTGKILDNRLDETSKMLDKKLDETFDTLNTLKHKVVGSDHEDEGEAYEMKVRQKIGDLSDGESTPLRRKDSRHSHISKASKSSKHRMSIPIMD